MTESSEDERAFFARADAFLQMANEQCSAAERPHVSASFLFALTRFHAFEAARTCKTSEELTGERDSAVQWFLGRYQAMLEQNLDDYIQNFATYMQDQAGEGGSGS
ncbi:MAG: DUF3144 domain-containing protein [Planctomycetota bacterium]